MAQPWRLALCGAALVALTLLGLGLPQPAPGAFGIGYGPALDRFVALACVQGLIYFAAIAVLPRRGDARLLWLILGTAVLLRLMVAMVPPFLSNDIYRYVWDGWVQAAGINPYRYVPVDPHLAFLRDGAIFTNINRASYAHTIYPPAAEMIFLASTALERLLHLPPVLGMKLALLALEAVGMLALLRLLRIAGLPRQRILIYAWNPLPVWEFAGSGHVDAIAVCFIALALLAAVAGRPALSALALAAAVLAKFLPIVLLPAIWQRWDWRFAAIFTLAILGLYAPYLGVGRHVLGFLGGYGTQEGISTGHGIFLLAALGAGLPLPAAAPAVYLLMLGVLLITLGAVMFFGPALPAAPGQRAAIICRRSMLLGGVMLLGLSPHYPWYYAWLLVPACIAPCASIIYLATASVLLYLNPNHTGLFWPALIYIPFVLLAARDLLAPRTYPAAPALQGEAVP